MSIQSVDDDVIMDVSRDCTDAAAGERTAGTQGPRRVAAFALLLLTAALAMRYTGRSASKDFDGGWVAATLPVLSTVTERWPGTVEQAPMAATLPWPRPSLPPLQRKPLYTVYGSPMSMSSSADAHGLNLLFDSLIREEGWVEYEPRAADASSGYWEGVARDLATAHGRVPDVMLFFDCPAVLNPAVQTRSGTPLEDTVFLCILDDVPSEPTVEWAGKLLGADVLLPAHEYLLQRFVEPVLPQVANVSRAWFPPSLSPGFVLPWDAGITPRDRVVLLTSLPQPQYRHRDTVSRFVDLKDERFVRFEASSDNGSAGDADVDAATLLQEFGTGIADSGGAWLPPDAFRIAASGALLLVDDSILQPLAMLGFVDSLSCILYNEETLEGTVDWIRNPENRAAVDRIRMAGQAVAVAQHQVHHRVQHIMEIADAVTRQGGRQSSTHGDGSTPSWWLPHRFPLAREWGPWRPEFAKETRVHGLSRRALGDTSVGLTDLQH